MTAARSEDAVDPAAPPAPSVRELLAAAVAGVGGSERPGQVEMAEAVAAAMTDGSHLLVQAGTGTGKSLAYLVPALLHGEHRGRGHRDDRAAEPGGRP